MKTSDSYKKILKIQGKKILKQEKDESQSFFFHNLMNNTLRQS